MIQEDRIISASTQGDDDTYDRAVRPKKLADYAGQPAVRSQMEIFIEAARRRSEALDHVLIFGPPGLGKTTLANIIANELGVNLKQTSGPVIERPGDLAALLTNLQANDVLFVDEIHRLSPVVEEILYPAMEDYQLDIMIGEGPAARSIKLDLPPFTLVGATTRAGLLTSPLRDRFGIVQRLEFYSTTDLASIVRRSAAILGVPMDEEGAAQIALRSRGTPRIANRLLRRVRDYAEVKADGGVTGKVAQAALDMLDVDPQGFDQMDRKLLLSIMEKFDGGPVGVESLAAMLGEDSGTIEDVIEPYLIQQGFLMRTGRGRMATRSAYLHFGLKMPERPQVMDTPDMFGGGFVMSTPTSGDFIWPVRVYWEDTDAGGVVYYANYLKFLERARTEWLRAQGVEQGPLQEQSGVLLVVARVEADYRRPAKYGDSLNVHCRISEAGRASATFTQAIYRQHHHLGTQELLLEAKIRVACIDAVTGRPKPMPEVVVNAMGKLLTVSTEESQ